MAKKHAPLNRIAKVLRAARKRAGMTQLELAKRSGVGNVYICRLELGHHSPSVAILRKLAKAMGVTLTALLK